MGYKCKTPVFSGKNTGVGCHSLLQGIFLIQGLNPGLLHYRLSHQGRSKEGNGNPLHHSCLENSMDRAAWQAIIHGISKELDMTE